MKQIPLTQGQFALVDDEDYEWLNQWKWCAHRRKYTYYAVRCKPGLNKKQEFVGMHRQILSVSEKNVFVDHKDHNGLNNQKSNLRACSLAENGRNRKLSVNNTSGYKGVGWSKQQNKWAAQIQHDNKTYNLGCYEDIMEAVNAYNSAAKDLHGGFFSPNKIP